MLTLHRVSFLLRRGWHLCDYHDLPSRTTTWTEESACLPLNMLDRRLNICHGSQSLWNCAQAHAERRKPVQISFDVCLHHCRGGLHLDANELLQQSIEPILDQYVSLMAFRAQPDTDWDKCKPPLLCYFYHSDDPGIVHTVHGIQHHGRRQYAITVVRIFDHLHRSVFAQLIPQRPGRAQATIEDGRGCCSYGRPCRLPNSAKHAIETQY